MCMSIFPACAVCSVIHACEGQKRVSEALELELQMPGTVTWVLGFKPESSGETISVLNL